MHSGLLLLSTDFQMGVENLKGFIFDSKAAFNVVKVSAIYKRFLNDRKEDMNSELVTVLRFETAHDIDDLFFKITALKNNYMKTNAVILSFDRMTKLNPTIPLPHPLLNWDKLILRLSAEVWPGWEHPILGLTLSEATRNSSSNEKVEFHAQGFHLISPETG